MRKPLLIYDGDCGFCRKWVAYWQALTGDRVDYASYQEVGAGYPEVPTAKFQEAVHLVQADGKIVSGARAVFAALAEKRRLRWLQWIYEHIPGAALVSEAAYRIVAKNRVIFSKATRLFWGDDPQPTRLALTRWLYLKALGVTYLAAFVSFWVQAPGLIGPTGILPIGWSEGTIQAVCGAGVAASVFLVAGILPTAAAIAAWVCYWFVSQAGQDFLGFQWDALMLEMGFFSVFLTLGGRAPKRLAVLVLRFLLFRVVFFSGFVKLASQDPHWRDLTALRYHFETQPLPTWIGWWFHQLPLGVLQGCAALMFVAELAVPFLFFLPRRPRIFAFFVMLTLQTLIDATGNYGFFGWQVMTLSTLLLDDAWFEKRLPWLARRMRPPRESWFPRIRGLTDPALVGAAALLVALTTVLPLAPVVTWAAPLDVIHHYGVFAVMTTQRNELVFEGSRDGQSWSAYELKWKPGDLSRTPSFCEPHMPRLDWQLWFAALSGPEQNPWVQAVVVRLLQNSAPVLALFESNPFPDAAPRFVRVAFYRYHFTDIASRERTGQWWKREFQGLYLPSIELRHL